MLIILRTAEEKHVSAIGKAIDILKEINSVSLLGFFSILSHSLHHISLPFYPRVLSLLCPVTLIEAPYLLDEASGRW